MWNRRIWRSMKGIAQNFWILLPVSNIVSYKKKGNRVTQQIKLPNETHKILWILPQFQRVKAVKLYVNCQYNMHVKKKARERKNNAINSDKGHYGGSCSWCNSILVFSKGKIQVKKIIIVYGKKLKINKSNKKK